MDEFRGYPVRREQVAVGGLALELVLPADKDALLDDPRVLARFAADEYLPYWAAFWPAALLLAEVVGTWPIPGGRPPVVLELGCGVGLVGLVAARRGYPVILSDYDADALAFAAENARRNGIGNVRTREVDWRRRYDDLRPDRIIAADILYELRNLESVATFVAQHLAPDGLACVSDPNRSTADSFADVAGVAGLTVETASVTLGPRADGHVLQGRIFTLGRSAGY